LGWNHIAGKEKESTWVCPSPASHPPPGAPRGNGGGGRVLRGAKKLQKYLTGLGYRNDKGQKKKKKNLGCGKGPPHFGGD